MNIDDTPVDPMQIIKEFGAHLTTLDTSEARQAAIAQFSALSFQITMLIMSLDDLVRRGQTLSPGLKAFRQTLALLTLSNGTMGITLSSAALNLHAMMHEIASGELPKSSLPESTSPDVTDQPAPVAFIGNVVDASSRFGKHTPTVH